MLVLASLQGETPGAQNTQLAYVLARTFYGRKRRVKHTYAEDKRNVTSGTALDFASGSHAVLIPVDTAIVLQ